MGAEYKVRLRSAAGALVAEVVDFLGLGYVKRVNAPGLATVRVNGEHAAISLLEHRGQVEIWRRDPALDLDWYCDFYGLYLDQEQEYTDRPTFTMRCPGQLWLLGTRCILWPASTADRTAFTSDPAETVMKTLVNYNAGSSATTGNGRDRTGTITGISSAADTGAGNTIDWYCARKNLLEQLQQIAQIGGGDFDLIKTGAATWEFRWYTGQRGTDRSATVIFSLAHGNMANPRYRYNRIGEATVCLAGGQGEGANRATAIRTGTDYAASNDVELFADARDTTTAAGLQAVADRALAEQRARQEFGFDVLQMPACAYGVHYCIDGALGDLVTARYLDVSATLKIVGVTVGVEQGGQETITPEMETQ